MHQKRSKPASANWTGSGIANSSPATCSSAYLTFALSRQEPIDTVGLIAARTGIAAATVRAHVEAFGIGGVR